MAYSSSSLSEVELSSSLDSFLAFKAIDLLCMVTAIDINQGRLKILKQTANLQQLNNVVTTVHANLGIFHVSKFMSLVVVYDRIYAFQIGYASSNEDGEPTVVYYSKLMQGPIHQGVVKSGSCRNEDKNSRLRYGEYVVELDLEEEPTPTRETYAPSASKTAKQLVAKRNQKRLKSILLIAIPDEYLLSLRCLQLLNHSGGSKSTQGLKKQPTTSSNLKNEDFQRLMKMTWKELDLEGGGRVDCQSEEIHSLEGRAMHQTNESSSHARVAQDGLGGYDWSNDFEVEPQNEKRAVHTVSTVRPVSTARPVSTVRPVSTTRPVSTVRPFAPKIPQTSGAIRTIYPRMDNGNPEILLHDHVVVDSGCSSHMTSNKAYLSDYEDYNGGFVAFGSDPKGVHVLRLEDGTEINMLAERRYPLTKNTLEEDDDLRLPVVSDMICSGFAKVY
ncbi:hypothetical protein Tco_0728919 [Tanacetum coccineum]|uniref:Retrovirus-related Pol polyprotein from transposon TNT 1-94-like beta-barrel domain-containing protein n=1 Tax=Tanacetum coccineum TaxID=301880 RepID=A0ABQ4YQL5_9ASTR